MVFQRSMSKKPGLPSLFSRASSPNRAPARFVGSQLIRPSGSVAGVLLGMVLLLPVAETSAAAVPADVGYADRAVHEVYQPAAERFSEAGQALQLAASAICEVRTPAALDTLQSRYGETVATFSALELYRTGPLLEENRQNRLFYWPDKRRVGERQMRALLAEANAGSLTGDQVAGKSVALQGIPALERLLFSKDRDLHFSGGSDAPDCQVVMAIAENIDAMAKAIRAGWQDDAPQVKSLLQPEPSSDYFRSDEEVLRSLVTQILVGADVVQDRKLAVLTGEEADLRKAPLWRSGQTLPMIRANLDSLRALTIDSGLAGEAGLENELAFEFRSADQMLLKLQGLPALTDEANEFTSEAESLLRSVMAVVGGIRHTLNDRFVSALGVSPGFNSEDGD